jgi:hypothetical protein
MREWRYKKLGRDTMGRSLTMDLIAMLCMVTLILFHTTPRTFDLLDQSLGGSSLVASHCYLAIASRSRIMLPTWQNFPVLVSTDPLFAGIFTYTMNYDWASTSVADNNFDAINKHKAVFSKTYMIPKPSVLFVLKSRNRGLRAAVATGGPRLLLTCLALSHCLQG